VTGNPNDIDAAVEISKEALACANLIGGGSSSAQLVNLGAALGTRYEALGDRQDLDDCIALYRTVIEAPDDAYIVRFAFCNLILSLVCRFDVTGEETDLDEALHLVQKEMRDMPPGFPIYVLNLQYLGGIFQRRYKLHRRPGDLTNAISALSDCLNKQQHQHIRADRLVDLAKTRLLRIKDIERTMEDIDEVIELLHEALKYRQPGHPRRHEALNVLSEAYAHRFECTSASADLTEAFRVQSESVNDLPPGHTYRAQALFGLARLHLHHKTSFYNVRKALELSIEAARDNSGTAQLSLTLALDVLSSLETVAAHPSFSVDERVQLLELYQHVISLIPRVAFFGLDVESRLRVLAKADSIATAAAMHAIAVCQPTMAIEVLEQGRGVFWAQALRLRTALDGLPKELTENLDTAARRLEIGTRASSVSSSTQAKSAIEEEALKLRQLSEKFEGLIAEVRALPGYERFLLYDEYSKLSAVSHNGPVVVFLSGKDRCSAIILRQSAPPQAIDIPNVTASELLKYGEVLRDAHQDYRNERIDTCLAQDGVESQVNRLGIASRQKLDRTASTLSELWIKVMRPVIQGLSLPVSALTY
jgi:hypothetical protein